MLKVSQDLLTYSALVKPSLIHLTQLIKLDNFKTPYRKDLTDTSGGLLVYVKTHISSRELKCPDLPSDIECIALELNVRTTKWLVLSVYRNPKTGLTYFLDQIQNLTKSFSNYENILILGDFNQETNNTHVRQFMETSSLKNLIKSPTCFKTEKGRCIDLILTNRYRCFQHSKAIKNDVSDHHTFICTVF